MKKKLMRVTKNKSIGIDLGTANTLVYSSKAKGIILNEPSVVAVEKNKKRAIAVGEEAKKMLGKTPDCITAIRPLNEGVIADYDITQAMIRYFIEKSFSKWSLTKPDVMICVPIEVSGVEKKAVLDATKAAGAREAYLIEEAVAAAIGSGIDIGSSTGSMIIDIGGGSTDVAVISLGATVVSTSIRVAGDNFDQDIIRYAKKELNILIGERTAERVKIQIASAVELEEEKMELKGRDIITGLPKTAIITSTDVLEATKESLMKIVAAVKHVLERTPPELAADIMDEGIVMAGGGSLIRNFPVLIEEHTHVKVRLSENPLASVVIGTGMALDMLDVLKNIERSER